MNTSFVLLRPEVCTDATVKFTLDYFQRAGISVDDVAVVTTDEVCRHHWIERHYANTHTFAYADSSKLSELVENRDEIKSIFFTFFHELWDTAMAESRILTAKDAMTVLGNLSARELSQRWWSNGDFHPAGTTTALGCAPLKLFSGVYIMRLAPEGNVYVVNGFYPAIHEACTASAATTTTAGSSSSNNGAPSLCRMTVSWPETAYTWEQFATDVVGRPWHSGSATPTTQAGLRRALYDDCDRLGLQINKEAWASPSVPAVMAALEVAAGPLESLAARCTWTGLPLEDDMFGRQLLQEGVDAAFVRRLLRNPVLLQSGEAVAAFDLTAALTPSQAVRLISELYVEHVRAGESRRAHGGAATGAFYLMDVVDDGEGVDGLTSAAGPRESAVVLVKPHARRPEVLALVEGVLHGAAETDGVTIDSATDIPAELVREKAMVEQHYPAEAHYALCAKPEAIPVTADAEESFARVFGVSWREAVAAGRVFNAAEALHVLGDLSAVELYHLWFAEEEQHRKVPLASGVWVCNVAAANRSGGKGRTAPEGEGPEAGPFFVINGFYPYLLETFTTPGACTRCYAISWPAEERERTADVASTQPTVAERLHSALSAEVLAPLKTRWQALGLAHPPDPVNDGLAISSGAAAAVAQRHIWLGTPLDEDPFYRAGLRPRGVSVAALMQWQANPVVESTEAGGGGGGRVRDLLMGLSASETIAAARAVEDELRERATEAAVNRAIVVLHPSAATAASVRHVRDVLKRDGAQVLAEGDWFGREVAQRLLGSTAMCEAAQLAQLEGQALLDAVGADARATFECAFRVEWEGEVVETVCGAAVACRELGLSPTSLMKQWSDCAPVRLGPRCHVAFLPSHQRYVVNGFVPYLQERNAAPGARAHYFDVAWEESRWTWADFATVIVGDPDIARAAAGSLQRSISEAWRELGLAERPCHRAQLSVSVSAGPLEAIADRVMWLPQTTGGPAAGAELAFLGDAVAQRMVAEGVPMGTIAYYAAGVRALVLHDTRAHEHALLRDVSTHMQTSDCVRRLRTIAASIQSASRQLYGFLWLQPSCAKPHFAATVPALLAAHGVHVRSQGELPITADTPASALLNGPCSPLYRNAWVRAAAEVPVTAAGKHAFHRFFGITWETAVQLSCVINAREAVERFGESYVVRWWDATPRKVCLSDDLYVGHLESEGVYVVNGFYPYIQSRLHAGGHRAMWYCVSWDGARMSWDDFQTRVVGDRDPAAAPAGSLRAHLHANWESYGLAMTTDVLETGVLASASPLEALADRCAWWGILPEQDVLGRLLLQQGVDRDFLTELLRNPPVYARGTVGSTVESIADAFSLLPRDPDALVRTLREWQSAVRLALLPASGAVLTSPRPLPLLDDDPLGQEPGPTEAQQREALVSLQLHYPAARYSSLPVGKQRSGSGTAPVSTSTGTASAVLALSPALLGGEAGVARLVVDLVREVLGHHGVTVAYEGTLSVAAAESRRVFDVQHERLMRFAMRDAAADLLTVAPYKEALARLAGSPVDASRVHNAVGLAEAFDLTPKKVDLVWTHCEPVVRLDRELYAGRVPAEDMVLVNGFAMQARAAFYTAPQAHRFLLLTWDEAALSYDALTTRVVGDAWVAEAADDSVNGVLRDVWRPLGLPAGPHPHLGGAHASLGALEAMRDRTLWLPVSPGYRADALGRRALREGGVSPFLLAWSLSNPREEHEGSFAVGAAAPAGRRASEGPLARLMELLAGHGVDPTLRLLRSLETNYRQQQTQQHPGGAAVRNTALLVVKPHALGRRFGRCVERVLARHRIHIDDEGDVTGSVAGDKGLVRTLYPATAAYAVCQPADLALSPGECARVAEAFGVPWAELLAGDRVVHAYDALERLGGLTPTQLYVQWRVSRHRLQLRPELDLTLLVDEDLYVVNGHFPALKQSFEAPSALLHWYVVSWPEASMSWAAFTAHVIGDENPAVAPATSVRGRLQARWRRYGLRSMPDHILNGLHVSSGPWHAMAERLRIVQPHLNRDSLGDLLLRRGVHEGLIEAWLANPRVTACGVVAGVFEHLAGFDTTRVVDLLSAVSRTLRVIEQEREGMASDTPAPQQTHEQAQPEAAEAGCGEPTASLVAAACPADSALEPATSASLAAGAADGVAANAASDVEDGEEGEDGGDCVARLVNRNVALLVVQAPISDSPAAMELLRAALAARGVRVISESANAPAAASRPAVNLLDELRFTEAHYALHENLSEVLQASRELHRPDLAARLTAAFPGANWEAALDGAQVVSAADAMKRLGMTAEDLHRAATRPEGETVTAMATPSLSLTRITAPTARQPTLFVANATYPLVRQSGGLRALVLAWDARQLPWRTLAEEVVGSAGPATAAPGSLREQLLHLSGAEPSTVGGLWLSSGPMQAYAERAAWFGAEVGTLTDALARAMAAVGVDPVVLAEWRGNPLVERADGTRRRLFDVLAGTDTPEVVAMATAARDGGEEAQVRVLPRTTIPHCWPGDGTSGDVGAVADGHPAGGAAPTHSSGGPRPSASKSRMRLESAKARDALLHARTDADVEALWNYYLELERASATPAATAAPSASGDTPSGPAAAAPQPTIDSAAFKRDFSSLETFGAPLPKYQVKSLFAAADARGGRMYFNEFMRAVATYLAM